MTKKNLTKDQKKLGVLSIIWGILLPVWSAVTTLLLTSVMSPFGPVTLIASILMFVIVNLGIILLVAKRLNLKWNITTVTLVIQVLSIIALIGSLLFLSFVIVYLNVDASLSLHLSQHANSNEIGSRLVSKVIGIICFSLIPIILNIVEITLATKLHHKLKPKKAQ